MLWQSKLLSYFIQLATLENGHKVFGHQSVYLFSLFLSPF